MMTPYNSDIICTQNYSECMYWKENMVMSLPLHCVKICKKLVQKPGQKSWLNLSFLKVPEVALVDFGPDGCSWTLDRTCTYIIY